MLVAFLNTALWGLNRNGQFITESGDALKEEKTKGSSIMGYLIPHMQPKSVREILLSELSSVKRQVHIELDVLDFATLSNREKGKRLLFLFQCDLLPGLSSKILTAKKDRDVAVRASVSITKKVAGYVTVLLVNAGMLMYIFLFALQQSKTRQSAWLQSFLIWFMCEVLFVSTIVVLLLHYIIPNLTRHDVDKIREKLKDSLSSYHISLASANRRTDSEDAKGPFNTADYLFVSTRLAKQFPDLSVSKVISHFRTPWPRRSYLHIDDVSQLYKNGGIAFIFSSFGSILLFMLEGYVQLPQGLQEGIVHSTMAFGVGYTVLLHAQLFDLYPALAFLPLFVLIIAVHFYIHTSNSKVRSQPQDQSSIVMPITDDSEAVGENDGKGLARGWQSIDDLSYNREDNFMHEYGNDSLRSPRSINSELGNKDDDVRMVDVVNFDDGNDGGGGGGDDLSRSSVYNSVLTGSELDSSFDLFEMNDSRPDSAVV